MPLPRRLRPVAPAEAPLEAERFYRARDLARRWRVHEVTVWKWSAAGKIPKPKRIGPNTVRWQGRTILAHEQTL